LGGLRLFSAKGGRLASFLLYTAVLELDESVEGSVPGALGAGDVLAHAVDEALDFDFAMEEAVAGGGIR
jgi:hypothetical protein